MATTEQFSQAANRWDLETLYADLASAKGKRLTPVEKLHLRGLLCGYSPSEIAEKLGKNPKGVETDLCATVYRYVKNLVDKCSEKIENWRNITEWLDESGYQNQSPAKLPASELLPENSVINVTNISIENNQIVFLINLRIPKSQASEASIQNLDLCEDILKDSIFKGSNGS
ncbi:helix-turn-helix transcriptional regulator [Limnofasciculus baicalensis]|uniref:Helix-turn-helix domain-containing protein n=1 Tax=Limnofasciculus baicalensis BBK-W-15 TaxID=2699891 RepID=A0AAE3KM26_9CYAN|nr:helix-turn-helix domain-containing protein [Limnofasciculus baicalensis]MCP2728326.1 helix-turn-helix domain-containing protein [Limnofasciculus baicalensis BBK-W-15]